MISLGWNSILQKETSHTSEKLEQTRIETGEVETLTNDVARDSSLPWRPFTESFSESTRVVGLVREIRFDRPFSIPPKVTLALNSVDLPPTSLVLADLGFKSNSPRVKAKISHVSVFTETQDVTVNGFKVRVGLSLPPEAAKFLEDRLRDEALVDRALVSDMRASGFIANQKQLTQDEIWMINFYDHLGTFNISWIAQAKEAKNGSP